LSLKAASEGVRWCGRALLRLLLLLLVVVVVLLLLLLQSAPTGGDSARSITPRWKIEGGQLQTNS
jgi:hypothetical protein